MVHQTAKKHQPGSGVLLKKIQTPAAIETTITTAAKVVMIPWITPWTNQLPGTRLIRKTT